MEPLHPDLRTALKDAHPSLTDEDIDRSEELLAERMNHDPVAEPERIAQLDAERTELIRQKMPDYSRVVQVFNALRRPIVAQQVEGLATDENRMEKT